MKQKGFSLIELMVAVAIVGILLTIAIPQYKRYEAKSRKLEAKTSLVGIYTSLRAFSTDNNSYTQCLDVAGFKPETGATFYAVGFTNPVGGGCGPGAPGISHSCLTSSWKTDTATNTQVVAQVCAWGAGTTYFMPNSIASGGHMITAPPGTSSLCGSSISKSSFKVSAESDLGFVNKDYWTIDQDRDLENNQDGLNEQAHPPCEAIGLAT